MPEWKFDKSVPEWKFNMSTMYFVMGLPMMFCKNNSIWVILDRLKKSTHFIAIRTDFSLAKLAKLYIRDVVKLHGVPTNFVLDRDPFWVSL